jgi:hypothetical protein
MFAYRLAAGKLELFSALLFYFCCETKKVGTFLREKREAKKVSCCRWDSFAETTSLPGIRSVGITWSVRKYSSLTMIMKILSYLEFLKRKISQPPGISEKV